jgi:excisionase family DNA binding protein
MTRDPQATPGKYLDVPGAARFLCVSVPTIRKWQTTGKLRRYHAGRRVLVKIEDLEALVVADAPVEGEAA